MYIYVCVVLVCSISVNLLRIYFQIHSLNVNLDRIPPSLFSIAMSLILIKYIFNYLTGHECVFVKYTYYILAKKKVHLLNFFFHIVLFMYENEILILKFKFVK